MLVAAALGSSAAGCSPAPPANGSTASTGAIGGATTAGSTGSSATSSGGAISSGSSGTTGESGTSTAGTSGGASSTGTTGATPSMVNAQNIAVIVNTSDPQSVAVGAHYQQVRSIPAANMFDVSFPDGGDSLDSTTFAMLKAAIDGDAGANIQAYALTWTFPYIVVDGSGCQMSITSAFTFGYAEQWCVLSGVQCGPTQTSPYYASGSHSPFTDLGIRPAMMLAGSSTQDVLDLIDRGAASDGTFHTGTAFLVITPDGVRSSRAPEFNALAGFWDAGPSGLTVEVLDNSQSTVDDGALEDAGSVMVYLVGLANVPGLETNQYLPGAIGDSLTSYGGVLSGAGQTTVLDWLAAGLTGSAGTVREPCNYPEKFSNPVILIPEYTSGETLLEAYWKSVEWPGEVLFTGEPLARPWPK